MAEEFEGIALKIRGDASMRSGVYANLTMVRTTGTETILDFVFIDGTDADDVPIGKVQSRVVMSNRAFAEMVHMIDEHFAANFEEAE